MRLFCGACLLLLGLASLASGLSETEEKNVAEVHPDGGAVQPVIESKLRDTRAADSSKKEKKNLKKKTKSKKKRTSQLKKKDKKNNLKNTKNKNKNKTANRRKKAKKDKKAAQNSRKKGQRKKKKSDSSRKKGKKNNNRRKKKKGGTNKKSAKESKRKLRQKLRKSKKKKTGRKSKTKSKKAGRQTLATTVAVAGNCNNVTCLNNILLVLKMDKDTVQNYMQQKKRMDARLRLGVSKAGKKAFMNETLSLLVSSFGGEAALKRKAPICAGRYNSTKANDGAKLLRNLSQCESKIMEACSFSLPNGTSEKMEVCNAAMLDYRVKVNITKDKFPLNCSNWEDLTTKIPKLKTCNSGNNTSAKANEKAMKAKMDVCKAVTIDCKGWEDQSMSYIATCKTSASNLKQILYALYKSKDKLEKVNTKVTSALTKATKEGRNKRSLGDCESLTKAVVKFTLYSGQVAVDTLGSNETIAKEAKIISTTKSSKITCTAAEKTTMTTAQSSINAIVAAVLARITEVMQMLSDLTGTSISAAELSANVVTIPTAAPENTATTAATAAGASTAKPATVAKKTTAKPATVAKATTAKPATTIKATTAKATTAKTTTGKATTKSATTAAGTTTGVSTTKGASTTPGASTTKGASTTPGASTTKGASTTPGASTTKGASTTPGASTTKGASTTAGASTSKAATTKAGDTTTKADTTAAGTTTATLPDQPDSPDGLQAKNTRLVENEEATTGINDAIDTLATATPMDSRSKRAGTFIVKSRTRGIKFKYIYMIMLAYKSALKRTVYSQSALMISKTILFTISKKNVLPPTKRQIVQITTMRTSLVIMIQTIRIYKTIVQLEIKTSNNNNGIPIDTQASMAIKLQMRYPYPGTVSTMTVMKDNKMHLIRLLKALMANRDGLLKMTTLITKVFTSTATISSTATTVSNIIMKVQGVEALAVCLYGREMHHSVIMDLSAELMRLVGFSYAVQTRATTTEIATLTASLSALNSQIVLITHVLLEIQAELIEESGGMFDIQAIKLKIISTSESNFGVVVEQAAVKPPTTNPVVLTAAQQEVQLTATLTQLRMILTNIDIVRIFLVKIQTNAMVSGSGTVTSVEVLITWLIRIVLLITNEQTGTAEFTTMITQLQAVTKVETLTTSQLQIIINLIEVVTMIEVTYTGSVSGASMGLIGNKGLVGQAISTDLSFADQAKAFDAKLKIQRMNCGGVDKAAQALEVLVESQTMKFICADKFSDDCDNMVGNTKESAKQLLDLILQVTKLTAENLEDVTIVTVSQQIVTLISSVTMLTMDQKRLITSMVLTMQSTVLVYVSQISIIESKRFEVGGAIVFPGASTAVVNMNDFAAQQLVLEVQLRNLFKISDSNDKVIDCISKVQGLTKAESPKKNKVLAKQAKKVPAMCGAAEPPVAEVQTTAAEIVKACALATERPNEGQLKSLLFIKTSLISFKMTFTSQITIFSQQLSDITGTTVTAATLKTTVILPSGTTGLATAVDISGGLTIGSWQFYIVRYQIIKSSIIAIGHVLTKITSIIQITSGGASGNTSPSDFALLVAQFNAQLSSGVVTESLMEIAVKILTAEVTSAPSKAIIINLNSALSTLNKLQMTCLSDVVVIKQRLVLVLTKAGKSLTEIKFSVKTISATGVITVVEEAASSGSATATEADLKSAMTLMIKSSSALSSVQSLVSLVTSTTLDFSSISTATNIISISEFMMKISRFLFLIGTGITNIEVHSLAINLMTYRVTSISQAYITQFMFIMSTIITYRVSITVEISMISSQISVGNPGGFSEEKNAATLAIFQEVSGQFTSFNQHLTTAKASQNQGGTVSAVSFFQWILQFFSLVISSSGFSSIATQVSTQVTNIQTNLPQVTPFSLKLIMQSDGIYSGMMICIQVIQAQIATIKIPTKTPATIATNEPTQPPSKPTQPTTVAPTPGPQSTTQPMPTTTELCLYPLAPQDQTLKDTGSCPAGFDIGDWSDNSGDCCCTDDEGQEPITMPDEGEEPITMPDEGEEPITMPTTSGSGEEPLEMITGGSGEEPTEMIGSGEEPLTMIPGGSSEEPVEMISSGGRWRRQQADTTQSMMSGGGSSSEEPVLMETSGSGSGSGSWSSQEPVLMPGTGGSGEEPLEMQSGSGQEPIEMVTAGSGQEPTQMVTAGSGQEPTQMVTSSCKPQTKVCNCRSGSRPTDSPPPYTGSGSPPTDAPPPWTGSGSPPTDGPPPWTGSGTPPQTGQIPHKLSTTSKPTGPPPTGPTQGTVPAGWGTIPHKLGSTSKPPPGPQGTVPHKLTGTPPTGTPTGTIPYKLTQGPMGTIPYLLKPSSTTMNTITPIIGIMPYKLPKKTTPTIGRQLLANVANVIRSMI